MSETGNDAKNIYEHNILRNQSSAWSNLVLQSLTLLYSKYCKKNLNIEAEKSEFCSDFCLNIKI